MRRALSIVMTVIITLLLLTACSNSNSAKNMSESDGSLSSSGDDAPKLEPIPPNPWEVLPEVSPDNFPDVWTDAKFKEVFGNRSMKEYNPRDPQPYTFLLAREEGSQVVATIDGVEAAYDISQAPESAAKSEDDYFVEGLKDISSNQIMITNNPDKAIGVIYYKVTRPEAKRVEIATNIFAASGEQIAATSDFYVSTSTKVRDAVSGYYSYRGGNDWPAPPSLRGRLETKGEFIEKIVSYGHRFHPDAINVWEINKSFEERLTPSGKSASRRYQDQYTRQVIQGQYYVDQYYNYHRILIRFEDMKKENMTLSKLKEFYKAILNDIGAKEVGSSVGEAYGYDNWEYEGVLNDGREIIILIEPVIDDNCYDVHIQYKPFGL
jgi:hypothetical protein